MQSPSPFRMNPPPPPNPIPRTPGAEVVVGPELVRALLADQHPDLLGPELRPVEAGWDNTMYRLGEGLAVRLPHRLASADRVEIEQTWLPRVAPQLSLPVPVPIRRGLPARDFPWRWSVVRWLTGAPADLNLPGSAQGVAWAAFLRSLHTAPPADAPRNLHRGIPLARRAHYTAARLDRLQAATPHITRPVREVWASALKAPIDAPDTWIHGDLHPRNVLVEAGVFTGVIDWGDLAAGDPATDLASIWMLLDGTTARETALAAYGAVSPATRDRARGWALALALVLLETGLVDNPRNAAIGTAFLVRLIDPS